MAEVVAELLLRVLIQQGVPMKKGISEDAAHPPVWSIVSTDFMLEMLLVTQAL